MIFESIGYEDCKSDKKGNRHFGCLLFVEVLFFLCGNVGMCRSHLFCLLI